MAKKKLKSMDKLFEELKKIQIEIQKDWKRRKLPPINYKELINFGRKY